MFDKQIGKQEKCFDTVWKLETNLDDCTGEALGYVMNKLLEAGARDVYYIPIYMKKNRPGYMLCVLCEEAFTTIMEDIIFANTTSIGIRRVQMERTILPREMREIETPLGTLQVKVCMVGGKERIYPEYESVVALAEANGISYQEVLSIVNALLQR